MILTRRAALNGVWLDEVDNRIVISGIESGDGRENIAAADAATGYGQRVTANRRSMLDVIIRFQILQHGRRTDGMQARAEVLEAVNAWAANGGYLTVNFKPDRRLRVILAQPPGEGSLRDLGREYAITFRAYEIPYWEQESAKSSMIGNAVSGASGSFLVEGSARTQVHAELLNMSGATIGNATITIGGQAMAFTDLGLGGNETLVVDHREDGLVRIRIRNAGGGYRSAMAKRTDGSANDFMMRPGPTAASFSAQRACRLTVSWRARYL